MSDDFNKPGRRMRIQAGIGVLLGIALVAYIWHAQGRASRDADRMLKEMPRAIAYEAYVKPCLDAASEECRQILLEELTNESPCEFLVRAAQSAARALDNGRPRPPALRAAWIETQARVDDRCRPVRAPSP
jgi:hypothetical protein